VYELRKALYGLKQAPSAWYGRLRGFLFSKGFVMAKVDKTFFLLRRGDDILIVQVYVEDIVFGGSSHSLVARFAKDMSKEFKISMMGGLQFFLGLQIKQATEGTFVHQAKYTKDVLKKFKMDDSKPLSTLMSTTITLDAVLTDKRCIPLRFASVRTQHLFHHGIPKVLVNPRSKGITSV
jgi:hypothetical protein